MLSFQRPDKIADAVRLVWEPDTTGLWFEVAGRLPSEGGSAASDKTVKERLGLIVDRRNAIVHEDDADGSGERSPIDAPLVEDAIGFIGEVVAAIDEILR